MKTKTFSKYIFSQIIWLATILFGSFLAILFVLSSQITEITISSLADLEAKSLARVEGNEPTKIYHTWQEIPYKYRQYFDKTMFEKKNTLEKHLEDEEKIIYLYAHKNVRKTTSYTLSVYNKEDIVQVSNDIFTTTISQIAITIFLLFIFLFFMLKWLINRSVKPYIHLSSWVQNLKKNPKSREKRDFYILEVNNIATQLENKIDIIQAYAKREKEFLQYTSHELRTPLAIIQASLDTLDTLVEDAKIKQIVNRAQKANHNINILSSALLYLARESTKPIKKTTFKTREFIETIINDHLYLIEKKEIEIKLNIVDNQITIEQDFFFIIVSNLIKNAFQYSNNGEIKIDISANHLSISNPYLLENNNQKNEQISFSLGLKLIELICKKLSFNFETKVSENIFQTGVCW